MECAAFNPNISSAFSKKVDTRAISCKMNFYFTMCKRYVLLPMAGNRNNSNGSLNNVGTNGNYWSSTVSSTDARSLFFSSGTALMFTSNRAFLLRSAAAWCNVRRMNLCMRYYKKRMFYCMRQSVQGEIACCLILRQSIAATKLSHQSSIFNHRRSLLRESSRLCRLKKRAVWPVLIICADIYSIPAISPSLAAAAFAPLAWACVGCMTSGFTPLPSGPTC